MGINVKMILSCEDFWAKIRFLSYGFFFASFFDGFYLKEKEIVSVEGGIIFFTQVLFLRAKKIKKIKLECVGGF